MKTKSWAKFSTVFAFSMLWASCGNDWGHVDPPAGIDYAPTLEKVCEYTFEDEGGLDASVFTVVPYPDGSMPALTDDEIVESKVLDLTGGYARIKNPLKAYAVQKGVSVTFWVKQVCDPLLDEEGNPVEGKFEAQDVKTPLLHWENLNSSCTFDFTANGGINYDGADGKISLNDASEYKTGYITPNEWHYVALAVRNDGYGLYVDGMKKAEVAAEKSLAQAVQLMAESENMFVNYGASTHSKYLIDDIKVYRNVITDKEISRPVKGQIGKDDQGGEQGFEPRKWLGVGLEDCTTPWWTPETFSPVVPLVGDGTVHFGFYNYNNGTANNWCNWLLVMTHGAKAFGQDGYGEYFVLRSDAYGWGELYDGSIVNHDFNWDTFCKEMDGAWVDMTIERVGEHVEMRAVITTSDNLTRNYSFAVDGVTEQTVGFFLLCEGSYLKLDVAEALVNGEVFLPNTYGVGLEDCSTPWWSPETFSKVYKYDTRLGMPFTFTFYNHNNGTVNNWCNWLLVCTNGKAFGEDGYMEYFVLRSDAYGWGSAYVGDNVSHGFNWDTFCKDMDGAYVRLFLEYDGETVNMTAKIISDNGTPEGTQLQDYIFSAPGIQGEIGFFLLCEGSYLDVRSVGYTPFRNQAN